MRGAAGAGDLTFSDVASFNLQLFANLGQQRRLVEAVPFLRGSRVTFGITNLFERRLSSDCGRLTELISRYG